MVDLSAAMRLSWSRVAWQFVLLLIWDALITVAYFWPPTKFSPLTIQFSLFGTAVALFLGFMVNASYARWWEARTLWGQIVNASRSLGREAVAFTQGPVVREVVGLQVAYVHELRSALRKKDLDPADHPEAAPFILQARTRLQAHGLDGAGNRPNAVLVAVARELRAAHQTGAVGSYERVRMETTLTELTNAQGGLERIRNTPLPVPYRVFPSFFARVFSVILPFSVVGDLGWLTPLGSGLVGLMLLMAVHVGHDLASPFAASGRGVAMDTLCKTVQNDLVAVLDAGSPVAETRTVATRA